MYRLPLADRLIESFRVDMLMESSRVVLGDARNDLRVINQPLIRWPGRFGLIIDTKRTASEMEMWRYALHLIKRGQNVGDNEVEQ